jgi:hypothetical protein
MGCLSPLGSPKTIEVFYYLIAGLCFDAQDPRGSNYDDLRMLSTAAI